MERTPLDIAGLHDGVTPHIAETDTGLAAIATSRMPLSVSRREFVGLTGAAAITLLPAGKAIGSGLKGPLECVGDESRLAFKLGGKERWIIDPARFAGTPKLTVERTDNLIRFELTGARYPGTELPADMTCELRRALTGWRMKLRLALGGFKADVPFEPWLAGSERARAFVTLKGSAAKLSASSDLSLSGRPEAEFLPGHVLSLSGPQVATLSSAGPEMTEPITADNLTIGLLSARDASLLAEPPPKRTLLRLDRGERQWSLPSQFAAPGGGKVVASGAPFDTIRVETGEDAAGRRAVLVVEPTTADASATCVFFIPGGKLTGSDGKPFALPLQNARYAVAFDPVGDHTALVATYHNSPVWVHANGCSLQVGAPSDLHPSADTPCPPFEVLGRGGEATHLRCEPALYGLAAPLAGAVVAPAATTERARVVFTSGGVQVAQAPPTKPAPPARILKPQLPNNPPVVAPKPQIDVIKAPIDVIKAPVDLPKVDQPGIIALSALVVPVLRPSDLLALTFQFQNLSLKIGDGGAPRLVRTTTSTAAYVTVSFPPQHIAEEAFLETAPEFGKNDQDSLRPPPVASRLAGPSRLVFALPAGVDEIPYTLDALLDWSRLQMSLAPTALPPPAPPRKIVVGLPKRPGPKPIMAQTAQVSNIKPRVGPVVPHMTVPLVQASHEWVMTPALVAALETQFARPAAPTPTQTAIEAPYRLIISPNSTAGWVHAVKPVSHGNRTELWHTRLGVRTPDGSKIFDDRYLYARDTAGIMRFAAVSDSSDEMDYWRTIRAIWSPDYNHDKPPLHQDIPFKMSLDPLDRHALVELSSNFDLMLNQPGVAAKRYRPDPVQVDRMMLSSLGIWMNVRGAWNNYGTGIDLEEWRHQATMGRDQYVKVVYKGYMFPFGHRASLIKVTERKFETVSWGTVAYLRQRYFIVIREPLKQYGQSGLNTPDGKSFDRYMPYKQVRITSLVTPNLDQPIGILDKNVWSEQANFWPLVNGKDFLFHLIATDEDGQTTEFTAPLVFVSVERDLAYTPAQMSQIAAAYTASGKALRETHGQKVALAQSQKHGDTSIEAQSVTFLGLVPTTRQVGDQPCFYPGVAQLAARLPAVEGLVPTGQVPNVKISDAYLKSAWDAAQNAGQVFADLIDKTPLDFPGAKSGGLIKPNMAISGLSRVFGPIGGDPAQLAGGTFNPEQFFDGVSALLFGAIPLGKIVSATFGDGKNVPKLVTSIERDDKGIPTAAKLSFDWKPDIGDFKPIFYPYIEADGKKTDGGLEMSAELSTPLRPGDGGGLPDPSYDLFVGLKSFTIDFYIIKILFDKIGFTAKSGEKPDVGADLKDIVFAGPLSFVQTIRDFIPLDGFKDPPYMDVSAEGIKVGFTLAIPSIGVGVFSIQNISLGAGLNLPFIGDPLSVRFAFCERENPFLLTVSMFGGGGFFATEISPKEVMVEASFEFGGNFSINLGVASGGVYVMAGVYFKTDNTGVTLTGYVRAGGSVNVLGIITVSIELYLSLTYQSAGNKVWGQASLTIEIEILFFSFGVTLTVEKEFAGSGGGHAYLPNETRYAALPDGTMLAGAMLAQADAVPATTVATTPPSFADLVDVSAWTTYCGAFA